MNKTLISRLLIFIFALLIIFGCRSTPPEPPMPHVQPKFAELYISTQGTTSTLIKSIDVTICLPSGVTVKATPDVGNPSILITNPGVVGVSGVAIAGNPTATGLYTAATASAPGKVMVHVADSAGFATGKFVAVSCDVANGSFPNVADFSLIDFKPVDLNGVAITGLTVGFTAEIF